MREFKYKWNYYIGVAALGALFALATPPATQASVPGPTVHKRSVVGTYSKVTHPTHHQQARTLQGKKARRVAAASKANVKKIRKITAGIQRFYQKVQTLCTNFNQVFKAARFTMKQRTKGKFFFKKPGMLRFFYKTPEAKHYIYNGRLKTLWMYYPSDSEVKIRKRVSRAQFGIAFQFLWGGGKMHKTFHIKYAKKVKFGRPGDIKLELIPRKPQNLFKKLYFVVIPGSYQIRETIYTDHAGNRNRFIFSGMKLNKQCRLKKRMFVFKAKKGVRVIPLR